MKQKRFAFQGVVLIAVVLMLASMIGACLVQSSGGRVTVEEVTFDTEFGLRLSGLIYRPADAGPENQVPGVIAVHGMYNNKEMQDSNLVELSRRGFAVMAVDLFSHGDSDLLAAPDLLPMSGLAALQYFAGLPYVDARQIGMTGHSMGGLNCDIATQMAVLEDGTPLVKALFLNCCFATYCDADGSYANLYGGRDVAILADQYDEFLFAETNADGTALLAKDFIYSDNAQSFLHFGADPSQADQRQADTLYHETIEGEDALRVIYTPAYTHPWSHFSRTGAKYTIEFFDTAFGSPVPIPADNQVWQWKELFNLIGLAGMALFACGLPLLLLNTRIFASLRADTPVGPRLMTPRRRRHSTVMAAAAAAFAAVSYIPVMTGLKGDTNGRLLFAQNSTTALGVWASLCGLFAFLAMWMVQRANKGDALTAEALGITLAPQKLALSLGLGALTVGCTYLWVVLADLVFKTDFRIWFTAAKTFPLRILGIAIFPNLFFFFLYFTANSLMVNCFGACRTGKGQAGELCFQILASTLPVLTLLAIQYGALFSTGAVAFSVYNGSSAHSMLLWLFPMLLFLPAAVLISRKIYLQTKNPYLPAFINACIVTFMTCANTSSWA